MTKVFNGFKKILQKMWLTFSLTFHTINYITASCKGGTLCRPPSGVKYISMATLPNTWYSMNITPVAVSNAFECQRACLRTDGCMVVSIEQPGLCYLGDANHNPFENGKLTTKQGWITMYAMHDKCEINPCDERGDCIPDYLTGGYTCKCRKRHYGDHCEDDELTKDWILVNDRVCFGALNNQFGSVKVSAQISQLALEWKEGNITMLLGVYTPTKWGGSGHYSTHHGDHTLGVVITDEADVQIFPATPLEWGFYQLPGFNSHSPYVVFNTGSRKVREGEVLRIWYGEDLTNLAEQDNGGKVCVSVYGKLCGI